MTEARGKLRWAVGGVAGQRDGKGRREGREGGHRGLLCLELEGTLSHELCPCSPPDALGRPSEN